MRQLEIEYVPIDEITPYAGNAKEHPEWQIEQIMESIREFGMNDPIAIWKDSTIIEGHGRLFACEKLGIKVVPVIRLDDLTEEQREAYILIHNQTTMNTGFNQEVLKVALQSIETIDMEQFGFDLSFDVEKIVPKKPEVTFTEVLGEEHNYIVLYFDNEVDWLQLQSIIDVDGKMNLSTRKDGKVGKNMKRISTGRVFNGAEVLEKMREHFEDLH